MTLKVVLMDTVSVWIITLMEGGLHAMLLSKLKMVMGFVLMLAAIAGAGAGAYCLRAQAPAPTSEGPSPKRGPKEDDKKDKKPEAAKDTKPKNDMTALLKARFAAAEKAYRGEWAGFSQTRRFGDVLSGVAQPENTYVWSVRWLHAQRALSPKYEDQVAALEAHFKRMTELHKAVKELSTDLMPKCKETEAEWYRLEAEIWLAKAKQAKAK